jgi:hypothetical protein
VLEVFRERRLEGAVSASSILQTVDSIPFGEALADVVALAGTI